jgi:kynurenine formamidase
MDWADFEAMRSAVRNWGRWGDTDELGTLNLITAEAIRHAATLVKSGRVFSLSMPINGDGPQSASGFRRNPIHLMTVTGGDSPASLAGMAGITSAADAVIKTHAGGRFGFTDDYLMMPLQAASHMDALSHAYFDGYFYNGVPASAVTSLGASRLAITAVGARGVCARGVLLDLLGYRGVPYLPPRTAVQVDELEAVAAAENVEIRPGDFLVVNTGSQVRHRETGNGLLSEFSGLDWRCATWLHDHDIAAVASDNAGIECGMQDGILPLHVLCLREMGMVFGEMWELEALAADCAADGVYEFQLVAAPLMVTGAVGAPVNALAIK